MKLHEYIPLSEANGPGKNTVFWFQGCSHGCKGCCNPHTWDKAGPAMELSPYELLNLVHPKAQGITLTGGEPLQQRLSEVVLLVGGAVSRGLRVTLFTGYTPEEINESEVMSNIVAQCHTVIMGRYRKDLPCSDVLKASSNQVVLGDTTGVVDAELHLDLDTGRMVITGVHR